MSNLENAFLDVIGKDNLKDLLTDYGEFGLDMFWNNETLKDIPIIGTIRKFSKLGEDIKGRIFMKKLVDFLFELKNVPERKRLKFIENLNKDPKKKRETGLKLILLIEKLDDFNKPQILSNLLIATIQEQITIEVFFLLSTSVSNTYIGDLKALKDCHELTDDVKERLYTNGLFSMNIGKTSPEQCENSNSLNKRFVVVEVESETKRLSNVFSDGKISVKEIKDKISIRLDFELNSNGILLKEFGLKNAEISY